MAYLSLNACLGGTSGLHLAERHALKCNQQTTRSINARFIVSPCTEKCVSNSTRRLFRCGCARALWMTSDHLETDRHSEIAAGFHLSHPFGLKRMVHRLANPLFEKRIRDVEMSPRVGVVLVEVSGVVKVRHYLVGHCWNQMSPLQRSALSGQAARGGSGRPDALRLPQLPHVELRSENESGRGGGGDVRRAKQILGNARPSLQSTTRPVGQAPEGLRYRVRSRHGTVQMGTWHRTPSTPR